MGKYYNTDGKECIGLTWPELIAMFAEAQNEGRITPGDVEAGAEELRRLGGIVECKKHPGHWRKRQWFDDRAKKAAS